MHLESRRESFAAATDDVEERMTFSLSATKGAQARSVRVTSALFGKRKV